MIVGVSANLLSRRTASPDQGRRAFGVWAFAAIGSPVALARAATLPTVASLRFGPHPPLEADGRGFVAGLAKSGFQVGENILLAQHDCHGSMANATRWPPSCCAPSPPCCTSAPRRRRRR